MQTSLTRSLTDTVALVAGATRGAGRGIAVELGASGARVYVTGRSSRKGRSDMDRPETVGALAADPHVTERAGQVLTFWDLAEHYGLHDIDGRRPNWDRHIGSAVSA